MEESNISNVEKINDEQDNLDVEKTPSSDISYECVRCKTIVTIEELAILPELKCICGYKVLKKIRPSVVKQIKAF